MSDPRERPLYAIAEAARYLGIPPRTLQSWVAAKRSTSGNASAPLIHLVEDNGKRMSFNNLIEAYVLKALRTKHDASMPAIRKALSYAERELGISRLLLRPELKTASGNLFWDQYLLVNLSKAGQIAMREMMEAHLKRVEWDTSDRPLRLFPVVPSKPEEKHIVIDPQISFGRPTIQGTGVATAIIVERINAGEDVDTVALDYGVEEDLVEEAIVYEMAA